MNDNRKKIIVNEILYWKKNKLLPEQYCNFLLALYTEGTQAEKESRKSINYRELLAFFPLLFLPTFVVLIYFTELSFFLQTALFVLFGFLGTFISYYFFKKGSSFLVPMISTALLVLLGTVDVVSFLFPHAYEGLYIVVAINCLSWLYIGKKAKLLYFVIASCLGLAFLLFSIFV